MSNKHPEVDGYFGRIKKWQKELQQLRVIVLECGLTEEYKWKQPCYTFQNTNVIILGGFKEHCVISFLKGILLNDAAGILVKPGENSQSVRMAKFTSVQEITELESTLKAYIYETIEVEKAGLKIDLKESKDLTFPDELIKILDQNSALKTAFNALTPGRQRAYNMHFSSPKQSATRVSRIEKVIDRILIGKGLNDCVCGFSKRMPSCDGSHKYL